MNSSSISTILILLAYLGYQIFKYIFPHVGKHLRGNRSFGGKRTISIVNLMYMQAGKCDCTKEEIENFKTSQKTNIQIIILIYALVTIVLLFVLLIEKFNCK